MRGHSVAYHRCAMRCFSKSQCTSRSLGSTRTVVSSAEIEDIRPGWGRLSARQAAGLTEIMDGGMGSLLLQTGVPRDSNIWSARCLEPAYHTNVMAAHCLFIEAGATLITTAN
eukprot:COSAG02_NODE_31546_length_531_cov_1.625000_2_plen_112_part_01